MCDNKHVSVAYRFSFYNFYIYLYVYLLEGPEALINTTFTLFLPVQIYSFTSTNLQFYQYKFTVSQVQIYSFTSTKIQFYQYKFTLNNSYAELYIVCVCNYDKFTVFQYTHQQIDSIEYMKPVFHITQ